MAKKNNPHHFSDVIISLAMMVEIVGLALKAVINSFEIYTINSLMKKKLRPFIMSKA